MCLWRVDVEEDKTRFPPLETVNSVKFNYFSNFSSVWNNETNQELLLLSYSGVIFVGNVMLQDDNLCFCNQRIVLSSQIQIVHHLRTCVIV